MSGLATGCGGSDCERDADCEEGFVCSESAGVLFAEKVCIAEGQVDRPDLSQDATFDGEDFGADSSQTDMGTSSDTGVDLPSDASTLSDMPPDPCNGVDCGPDGTCVVDQRQVTCECADGAAEVGGRCFASCPEHPDCRYWELNGDTWTSHRIDGLPDQVVGAFDIEGLDVAFVLTPDELFRLDLETHEIGLVGSNAPVVGSLQFDEIFGGFSIPASHFGNPPHTDTFQVLGLITGVPYFSNGGFESGEFEVSIEDTFEIPEFDETTLQAFFLDIENIHGWAPTTSTCTNPRRPISVMLTPTHVHYGEVSGGACSGVQTSHTIAESPMFGLDSAPPASTIQATFFTAQRLSAFTAP